MVWNQELEALADPMRKEVATVRKKIDAVNKELKPLGHTCQKKVIFLNINLLLLFFFLVLIVEIWPSFFSQPLKSVLIFLSVVAICSSGERVQGCPWSLQRKEQGEGTAHYQADGG